MSIIAIAQERTNQIEFVHENDKLVLLDKYYTSGLFLSYKRTLKNDFIFKNTADNKLQFQATLGNQTYTPTDLSSFDPGRFDRPFAGWLYLKTAIAVIEDNSFLELGIETGLTGKQSLSGDLQTWFHDFVGLDTVISWEQEIENKFLVNLKTTYKYNIPIGIFQSFQYVIVPSIGTKDIFLENGIGYYAGKLQAFKNSSRTTVVANHNENEIYGFLEVNYRYVFHNALIQGSLDYDDETFTSARTPHIIRFKVGGVLKHKRNTYRLIYNFNTKETPASTSHSYGSLVYSYDF